MAYEIPTDLMTDRIDLYGFAYPIVSGAKVRTPIEKKAGIRSMVQDAQPEIVNWYWQRQEKVTQSVFLIDQADFDAIAINDRIVYRGNNYRVAGITT